MSKKGHSDKCPGTGRKLLHSCGLCGSQIISLSDLRAAAKEHGMILVPINPGDADKFCTECGTSLTVTIDTAAGPGCLKAQP